MYFVYLALCADKSIYTGITNNLSRRLKAHQKKRGGGYTAAHAVKKFIYAEPHRSRSKALKREYQIKQWPKKKKLVLASQGRPAKAYQ